MIIHTAPKDRLEWFVIQIIFSIMVGLFFYHAMKDVPIFLIFGMGISVFMIIAAVYENIWVYRTLIMDEKGCTIRAFRKERYYTWDEFAIKRLEEHLIYMKARRGRKKGYVVFFSVDPVDKPLKMNPVTYWKRHPSSLTMFSFELALFEEEIFEPGYDEKYFREKMKEWNVELEVIRTSSNASAFQ